MARRDHIKCGGTTTHSMCPKCRRRSAKDMAPTTCPGCKGPLEYKCKRRAPCDLHPGSADALPLVERMALSLGPEVRKIFDRAQSMTALELHRLTTAWSIAKAHEAQGNASMTEENRITAVRTAALAAKALHHLELVQAERGMVVGAGTGMVRVVYEVSTAPLAKPPVRMDDDLDGVPDLEGLDND